MRRGEDSCSMTIRSGNIGNKHPGAGRGDGSFGFTRPNPISAVVTTVLMGLLVTGCVTEPDKKTTLQARLDEERIPITADRQNSRVTVIRKTVSNQQRLQARFANCYSGDIRHLKQLEAKLDVVAIRKMEIPTYRRVYGSGEGEGGGGDGGGGGC